MLALVRFKVKNDFCVSRELVNQSLMLTGLIGSGKTVDDLVHVRSESDCFRAGLSYVLDSCGTVIHDSSTLRIIKADAKTFDKSELRIDLHFQKRGSAVNYIHIGHFSCSITNGTRNSSQKCSKPIWEWSDNIDSDLRWKIPGSIIEHLERPAKIVEIGRKFFASDARKLVDVLLVENLRRIWAGTWIIVSDEIAKEASRVSKLMEEISRYSEAKANLSILGVEDTVDNKKIIAEEVSESFIQSLEEIVRDYNDIDVDDKKFDIKMGDVKNRFIDISNEASSIQKHLGVELDDKWYDLLVESTLLFA